ncbi:hypothetical protein B0H21DRAFT_660394, partial [Amylocystis lapponica]
WEALLFYLYTGNITFAPLKSEGDNVRQSFINRRRSKEPNRPAPCSCKSIYRTADEVCGHHLPLRLINNFMEQMGLDALKHLALDHLKSRLSAKNILTEIFSTFTSQ